MSHRKHIRILATASLFFALAAGHAPADAGGSAQHFRPVGPHEPILASIGEKRLVASFAAEFGHCAIDLSVWDSIEAAPDSSVRGAVELAPGEMLNIANPKNQKEFLGLQCSEDATKVLIRASNEE